MYETMELRREDSDNSGVLVISGEINITCSKDLKDLLIESLEGLDSVLIDIEGVTEADLSGLQVLCSAHRTARGMGKRLALSGKCPESFRRLVEAAGFFREKGCDPDGNEPCLWVGGE